MRTIRFLLLMGLVSTQFVYAQQPLSAAEVAKKRLQDISRALDMFYTDCNRYPNTEEGLAALISQPSACTNWGPDPYIKSIGNDPWGNAFL